jgi:hypothetical protein
MVKHNFHHSFTYFLLFLTYFQKKSSSSRRNLGTASLSQLVLVKLQFLATCYYKQGTVLLFPIKVLKRNRRTVPLYLLRPCSVALPLSLFLFHHKTGSTNLTLCPFLSRLYFFHFTMNWEK